LRQIISDTDRDGEWPSRFNRTIVPYSILDGRIYDGDDGKKNHCYGLSSLDPAPHFDLVIIDEAHHIRNGSLDKEKAYAYKCVKYFCDHADAVVMLTATPLQTGDDDLFTLLNVLRPDIVLDKATFRLMSEPNAYISRCARIVRAAEDGWQSVATEELENLQTTRWGDNVIAQNFLSIGDYFNNNAILLPGPGFEQGFFFDLVEASQEVGERPTAAFPSSHVGISTICMIMAWRVNKKLCWFLSPFYVLLCCATVYIQAHYLIDVFAGWISAVCIYILSTWMYKRWFASRDFRLVLNR
jgi:hypothetical protein